MSGSEPLRLLIDTDIGTDDAVAILLALRSPGVRVEAITAVAGNTDVDQCVRNARYVLELCARSVPLYRGADSPLAGARRTRPAAHGDDGLGGLGLRPRNGEPDQGDAVEALIQLIRDNPNDLTLVTLGPLTNVARALSAAPEIAGLIRRVVAMAGAAFGPGTATPRAEFNVWSDPEAARRVVLGGMPLTLVDIELSRGDGALTSADLATLDDIGTPYARFAAAMSRASASRVSIGPAPAARADRLAGLPDAIAMAVAIEPALVLESGRYYVDVETAGELTSGETVVDRLGLLGRPANADCVEAVAASDYKQMLFAACR